MFFIVNFSRVKGQLEGRTLYDQLSFRKLSGLSTLTGFNFGLNSKIHHCFIFPCRLKEGPLRKGLGPNKQNVKLLLNWIIEMFNRSPVMSSTDLFTFLHVLDIGTYYNIAIQCAWRLRACVADRRHGTLLSKLCWWWVSDTSSRRKSDTDHWQRCTLSHTERLY